VKFLCVYHLRNGWVDAQKLHTYKPNYRAWKALIAAEYNGVRIEVPEFNMGKDNKTPEFLAKAPLGKVPVLETPQGSIFESNAIARYVARLRSDTDLYGASFFESALVDQWVDFSANEVEPATAMWLYPIKGWVAFDTEAHAAAVADVEKSLTVLENHLATRTFLVGHRVTLADIVVASALTESFTTVFDAAFRGRFVNVTRWFTTCVNQSQFSKVIGKVELCAQAQVAKASEQKQGGKKEQKKEKEQKPKEEKKPKEQKPKEEKKPKEEAKPKEEDVDEDGMPVERKEKDPLDSLPKSTMVLDSVKKLYFEHKADFAKFFPVFWPQYDAEGYSIWVSKYNYDADNKVFFMTCNLVNGFIQRLEELRKYAFGVLTIVGKDEDNGPYPMTGAWIFRGKGLPTKWTECPDSEYYTMTQLDVSTPEGRKTFEDHMIGEQLLGQAVLERRYFK